MKPKLPMAISKLRRWKNFNAQGSIDENNNKRRVFLIYKANYPVDDIVDND
jgi:hypothetical protein